MYEDKIGLTFLRCQQLHIAFQILETTDILDRPEASRGDSGAVEPSLYRGTI